MRKRLLFPLAILLYALPLFAQKEIGIKAGVTHNKIRSEGLLEEYLDPVIFYSAGASGNFWLHQHLFLSTGINYERTGSRINDLYLTDGFGNTLAKGDLMEQLDYVTLPLSLHYSFGTKNKFALGAGMFGSYLLGAHMQARIDSGSTTAPTRGDVKTEYEDLNYGMLFHASYRIPIQKNRILVISAEDHLGLNNIRSSAPDSKYKTHSIGLYASFLFLLK